MFVMLFIWPENASRFIVNLEAAELWKKFLAIYQITVFGHTLKGRDTEFMFILLLSLGLFHVYIGKHKTTYKERNSFQEISKTHRWKDKSSYLYRIECKTVTFNFRVSEAFRNKKKMYDFSAVENGTVHMKKL